MKFSELHQLLQEKLGIDHLADLARELGVSPQAVSNWKARDRVPYKYVLKIRKQLKVSDTQAIDQRENNVTDSNQVFTQNKYPHYYDEDTISVSDILLVIAGQLKIIIITPLILCTITFFNILFNTTPVFKSSAKIMASSSGGNSQTASGIAAQFGITLPTSQSEPQWVYPQIIKSRTLARAMLKRRFDTEKYGSQTPLLQILTYGDQKPTVGLDTLIKAGVDGVIAMIQIEERGSFYNLTISGFEPLFVRDFANALIEELDKHQRKYNKAKKSETRNFIEERIIDTRKELEIAEEDLKNFSNHNRRIENSPALQLERQRLAREVSVLTGVFTTLKQQLETTKIEEVKDTDYVVVLDPPEAPLSPEKSNKKRTLVFACILGLGLGIIIGFVKEYIEKSDQDDQEKMGKAMSLIIKNFTDFLPRRFKKK